MSLNRYNPRRDGNEKGIVEALERSGCIVLRLSGRGVPDLLVSRGGLLYALECKVKSGRLTKAQKEVEKRGWPVKIARTPEQALHAVGL